MTAAIPKVLPISNQAPLEKVKIFFTFVQLRKSKNLTQTELAKELGCDKSFIALIETGRRKPNPEFLHKIADYFQVDVEELVIDAPTAEMAVHLIGEDVYDLYHGGKGKLTKEVRHYLLQVIRTLKPVVLAEETIVTKIDEQGNRVKESTMTKLAQYGIQTK